MLKWERLKLTCLAVTLVEEFALALFISSRTTKLNGIGTVTGFFST
jgi:hypothetical protein